MNAYLSYGPLSPYHDQLRMIPLSTGIQDIELYQLYKVFHFTPVNII